MSNQPGAVPARDLPLRPGRPWRRPGGWATLLVVLSLGLAACTTQAEPLAPPAATSAPTSASASGGPGPDPTPSSAPNSTPGPSSPSEQTPADDQPRVRPSLAEWFDQIPEASALRLGNVREQTPDYTSYDVRYRSDGLWISGVLNVPTGPGPFPAVVLAHGYIDPDTYWSGQGMPRERAYLAERGYVALHTDYRGHASSDDDPAPVRNLDVGYAFDALGAVVALRRSDLPVDPDRISIFGRSMGGGVALQALEIAPGLVDAGIVYSGVSSSESDNYDQWGGGDSPQEQAFIDLYGTPQSNPAGWRAMSARSHFDRITEPVLVVHGTRDDTCPPRWARATSAALQKAGVDVQTNWYEGENHQFESRFEESMRDIVTFLDDASA